MKSFVMLYRSFAKYEYMLSIDYTVYTLLQLLVLCSLLYLPQGKICNIQKVLYDREKNIAFLQSKLICTTKSIIFEKYIPNNNMKICLKCI